jgi:hypothetical protein
MRFRRAPSSNGRWPDGTTGLAAAPALEHGAAGAVAPGSAIGHGGNAARERHQLVLRFALFNAAAFALLGAAYGQGWIGRILAADVTSITVGIFIVFLGGLAACAREIWRISLEMNAVLARNPEEGSLTERYLSGLAGRDAGSRAIVANAMRTQLASRIAIIRYVANILVLLGLIGTVLGFVIALSAVSAEGSGDVSKIAPMVAKLLVGMSVALYTTLVGTVLHLWLGANYHILAVGVAKFTSHLIARGERRG